MSAAEEMALVSSEFDIFAHRIIQTFVLGTTEVASKPRAPVDKNGLEFFIHSDNDTYIDLDIKLYVRVKLISPSGKDVDFSDQTGVTNNFLLSLNIQCNVILNCINITQANEH